MTTAAVVFLTTRTYREDANALLHRVDPGGVEGPRGVRALCYVWLKNPLRLTGFEEVCAHRRVCELCEEATRRRAHNAYVHDEEEESK